MATYRDYAVAACQNREAAEETARQAARDALVAAARQALVPVFTDTAGKLVADPVKITAPAAVDQAAGMVVLSTTDGSQVSFAVYPNQDPVERWLVVEDTGRWRRVTQVVDLDDVGEAIAGGLV